MRRRAGRARISFRRATLLSFGVFVAAMLGLLWLFQIVLLDDFYALIKKRAVSSAMEEAAAILAEGANYAEELDDLSENRDVCISVVNDKGEVLYVGHVSPSCIIHNVPNSDLIYYYLDRVEEPGDVLEDVFNRFTLPKMQAGDALQTKDEQQWHDEATPPPARLHNVMQSMLCMRFVSFGDGSQALLLVNATLTPVNATVQTLRLQLMLVTLLLAGLAAALGFALAGRFSRPIAAMSREAEKLARGDFSAHFSGDGFREAAQLADTLNYAAAELGRTEELRRELMANVSHDLRTPLTMIEGFAEMMRDLPGENTPENAQVIVDEARYLSALVRDILDLSKLEAGVQEMTLERLDLSDCVREMAGRYSAFCQKEGFVIDVEAPDALFVQADRLRLQQVLYNLINNAVAYTGPDKRVFVSLRQADGAARVEVRDTGKGIAPEDLPYVWDRYYKVDKKTHQRALVGTGLGLSIVRKVLEAHKARFGVESGESGSTFWFELPLEEMD